VLQECPAALQGMQALRVPVQQARAQVLEAMPPSCPQQLAAAQPWSECGDAVPSTPWSRSIARAELYCDAISWQFYEMGSGDDFRKHCPHHPTAAATWVQDEGEEESDDADGDL